MCQSQVIFQTIGRIGYCSYDRSLRIASPDFIEQSGEMDYILNEVDLLCERLHCDFPTISADDYAIWGERLQLVIDTLKLLLRESQSHEEFSEFNGKLQLRIEDLEELNHDIKQFRVEAQKNEALNEAITAIGNLDFSSFKLN